MAIYSNNYLSVCTGAGGLDLGVELGSSGDAVPVCYVENEVTAAATLVGNIKKREMVDAPIWSDIKTFDFAAWRGQVDGIVGGYPCTPWSKARKGADDMGVADPRHLWPYIEQGIATAKPVWCFFENVNTHLSFGFDIVTKSLHSLGYQVAATLVSASDVGAPHIRKRLFILAYSACEGHKRQRVQRSARTQGWTDKTRHIGSGGRSLGPFPPGPTNNEWNAVPQRLHPAPIKSELHRLDDGMGGWLDLSSNDRIRLAGNGVVPQQAALAWQKLWREFIT